MLEIEDCLQVHSEVHCALRPEGGVGHGLGCHEVQRGDLLAQMPTEGECSCLSRHSAFSQDLHSASVCFQAATYQVLCSSCFRSTGWHFQQDGASVHKARTTTAWLHNNGVRLLNGDVWPPMSPDLNPIEHLWPMVLRRLDGAIFAGKDQLWTALQEAFAAITPEQVQALYASLPRRMEAVIGSRGGPTRY